MKEKISFGAYILALREKKKLTKSYIANSTGISEKTLRRIELNKVVPRIETLKEMSFVFKEDLVLAFIQSNYQGVEMFEQLKLQLEEKIKQNDFNDLDSEVKMLKRLIEVVDNPYYSLQLQQYICLIEGILSYRKDENYLKSMNIFVDGIFMSDGSFIIERYEDFSYSPMEIRLLMNIAFVFNKIGDSNKYLEILNFIMKEIDEGDFIYSAVIHNLATAYKRSGRNLVAIGLATKGIDYCKRASDYSMLSILYYGKGVSEFQLNRKSYRNSFKSALLLTCLQGQEGLNRTMSEKCKEHYQFDIDTEMNIFLEIH